MSATITDNATAVQVQRTLADYNIRLTGADAEPIVSAPNPQSQSEEVHSSNVVGWPRDYRRVPSHRPLNRNLDMSLRPGGSNFIERAFIFTMIHGVWLNATMAQTWNKTGGRINSKVFRYKIGGEW